MHVTKHLLDNTIGKERFNDAVLMPNPALFQSTAPSNRQALFGFPRARDSYTPAQTADDTCLAPHIDTCID